MSNAETAPSVSTADKPKIRHLHRVENTAESEPGRSDVMVGYDRETKRDRDAIREFIRVRDYYKSKGYRHDDAILKAADEYERTIGSPVENWGQEQVQPEPPKAPEDPYSAETAGLIKSDFILPEAKPEFITKYEKSFRDEEARQIDEVRRMYMGESDVVAEAEKKKKIAEIRKRFASSHNPHTQKSVSITDEVVYIDPDGKKKTKNVEGNARRAKEQLNYQTPAIEASYKVRLAALDAGKSVVEADELGAAEYERVITEIGVANGTIEPEPIKTTPEGRREKAAIHAFNKKRDEHVPHASRNAKFDRATSLHLAANMYQETLEHVEHLGHSNPNSIFADSHHDDHGDDEPANPTPNKDDSPDKEKGVRAKKARAFAKNAFTVMKAFVSDKSKRSALIREPLYRINDTVGNFIDDSKWLVGNRLLGRAGLNNQFVDWQHVLNSQPEPGQTPHEKAKTERKEKANTYIDSILEPVMRNWNYRATPQDKYVMPVSWPRSEREHPHEAMINGDTLVELGIRAPKNQIEPLVDYLNDALREPVDRALSRTLSKSQAEELSKVQKTATADEMKVWVKANIPDFAEIVENQIRTVLRSRKFLAFRNFLNTRVTL